MTLRVLRDIECVASGIGGGKQAVEVTFQTRAVDGTLQTGAPASLMRDATTAIVTTAKHNYVAQAPDELSLVKGAVIYVYPNQVEVSVLMRGLVRLFMSLFMTSSSSLSCSVSVGEKESKSRSTRDRERPEDCHV